jgi:Zn-dependent metalloprotease
VSSLEEIKAPITDSHDHVAMRLLADTQEPLPGSLTARLEKSTAGAGSIEIYDAGGQELKTGDHGTKARFEGEKPTGNLDVDNAYDYASKVRDFYREVFGRNSIDGRGMKIISRVNYGKNTQDAYWDGEELTFGKPDSSSPYKTFVLEDIIGHEITHAVSEYESHPCRYGQSGALNESISDVFGELAQQWSHHEKARDSNWILGEGAWKPDVNGRGVRDMLHPGTAFNNPEAGKDTQPDHMDRYVRTTNDNGGCHVNSGIPNKVFADFAVALDGYAWEEAGHIWYEARKLAGRNPSFAQFAQATLDAARKLNYERDVPKLEESWKKVGVTPSATQGDDLTPGMFFPNFR